MLCKMVMAPRKKVQGKNPVHLNVYDLTPINGYAYWLGLGVYHSGVQGNRRTGALNSYTVHGVEYAFGAHDRPTTGIFEVEPRRCPGFTFRKSIYIGSTDMSPSEVRAHMEKLADDYTGNAYHLIMKNCNHFCNDVCLRLTGKSIPRWVNRLARLGFLCNCVLPPGLNETKIRQVPLDDRAPEGDRKKMRSHSKRYDGSSNPHLSSGPAAKSSSQRHCLPPSSSFIKGSSTSSVTIK